MEEGGIQDSQVKLKLEHGILQMALKLFGSYSYILKKVMCSLEQVFLCFYFCNIILYLYIWIDSKPVVWDSSSGIH